MLLHIRKQGTDHIDLKTVIRLFVDANEDRMNYLALVSTDILNISNYRTMHVVRNYTYH